MASSNTVEVSGVRFCPKCGGIMLPVREGGKTILKCQRCGYTIVPDKKELETYKNVAKPDEKAKVISTKIVSKARRVGRANKEELEQAREDYYEFVLEQIGEYGE